MSLQAKNTNIFYNIVIDNNGVKKAILQEDLMFYVDNKMYRIPKGFASDGCSIPKSLRWLIGNPLGNEYIKASIIHDWLYYTHIFNRRQADIIFYKYLLDNGNCKYKSYIMFYTVRIFGINYWRNKYDDMVYMAELICSIEYDRRSLYDFGIFNNIKGNYFLNFESMDYVIDSVNKEGDIDAMQ